MKTPSIVVAFAASVVAGIAVAGTAMPPITAPAAEAHTASATQPGDDTVQFAQSRRETYRQESGRVERRPRDEPVHRHLRKTFDCHRDVRTHWLGGAKVTHRHVGDNCEVRIVRESTVSQ